MLIELFVLHDYDDDIWLLSNISEHRPMCCIDTDVNECQTNNGGCHSRAICTNTYGSFRCRCRRGYIGNGLSCYGM